MCLVGILFGVCDEFPLVIAHNRDEDISRETTELHVTSEDIVLALDHRSGSWIQEKECNRRKRIENSRTGKKKKKE